MKITENESYYILDLMLFKVNFEDDLKEGEWALFDKILDECPWIKDRRWAKPLLDLKKEKMTMSKIWSGLKLTMWDGEYAGMYHGDCSDNGKSYAVLVSAKEVDLVNNSELSLDNIFPRLNIHDREFLRSGKAPENWHKILEGSL